jgi:hypothetical protein
VRYLRLAWSTVTSLSTLAWLLSFGIGGLVTTGLSQVISLEAPWNVIFLASAFMVAWALAVPFAKSALTWISAELTAGSPPVREEDGRDLGAELRTVRTIRNEIDEGRQIVESAIGQEQVYETVPDAHWFAHRNSLAEIPEAGDAFRLAGVAWRGFDKYNNAVKGRGFISNEDLEQIARDGRQASRSSACAHRQKSRTSSGAPGPRPELGDPRRDPEPEPDRREEHVEDEIAEDHEEPPERHPVKRDPPLLTYVPAAPGWRPERVAQRRLSRSAVRAGSARLLAHAFAAARLRRSTSRTMRIAVSSTESSVTSITGQRSLRWSFDASSSSP